MSNYKGEIRAYQAVIIYHTDLNEEQVKEETEKVRVIVEQHKGSVTAAEVWGKRQLAYKIGKQQYGTYVVVEFSGNTALVADLNRQLRINDQALRHLVVDKDKFAPDLSEKLREQVTQGSYEPRERGSYRPRTGDSKHEGRGGDRRSAKKSEAETDSSTGKDDASEAAPVAAEAAAVKEAKASEVTETS